MVPAYITLMVILAVLAIAFSIFAVISILWGWICDQRKAFYDDRHERAHVSEPKIGGIIRRTVKGELVIVVPGVIDDDTRKFYVAGQCHAMALALHAVYGYDIYALHDGELDCPVHYAVMLPERENLPLMLLDVLGVFEPATHPMAFPGRSWHKVESLDSETFNYDAGAGMWWQIPDIHLAQSFVNQVIKYSEPFVD